MEFAVEFFAFAGTDSVDEIGIEVGDRGVEDFVVGVFLDEFVTDGLNEMGFTEPGAAVKKEGIVTVAGGIDDVLSGGESEVVIGADDERIKRVFGIETGVWGRTTCFSGFEVGTDGAEIIFDGGIATRDFAGTDFGFGGGLDFESDVVYGDIVVFEGGFNEVVVTVAELFDVEGVFDADEDVAISGRGEGSILEPG